MDGQGRDEARAQPVSRLERQIVRVTAQRGVLDFAAAALRNIGGPVVELGLGNGRTFDHLRLAMPGRRILAFDRALAAHATSVPPPGDLVLGEIRDTVPAHAGIGAALVHADIGTGYPDKDAEISGWLGALVAPLLRPGGLAASGLAMRDAGLAALPLPAGVPPGAYFLYRRED